ncbi:MAG TPA: MFS transporter [Armatimonadota bacterium]|jgi:MFS family permease
MKKALPNPTRVYSFIVPACLDGMLGLVQTAIPLLALRFGATALFLGLLGGLPQAIRFPFCLKAGHLSDRIGRTKTIIPAILILLVSCLVFTAVRDKWQLLLTYAILMGAVGAFNPSVQAFIGDHSTRGGLRKNLAAFNAGWAIGGAVTAVTAGFIFAVRKDLPFVIGACMMLIILLLIISWSRLKLPAEEDVPLESQPEKSDDPNPLLFIARVGHFLGFFSFSAIRSVFPKLGVELHMSEGMIGLLVGIMLVGQAIGMLLVSLGPWWRGKLWPIVMSQLALIGVGFAIFFADNRAVMAAAMFFLGITQVVPYTCSLYYGLESKKNMGKNTGIHEALVAASIISGSLLAGSIAQYVSLRAPYMMISIMAFTAAVVSILYWRAMTRYSLDRKTGMC